MYYCGWCKTRTTKVHEYPHTGIGCSQEDRRDITECDECGWERELLCSVCEGGVTEVEWSVYNRAEDTPQSTEIFDGWVKTEELAGFLAARMADKDQFWADREAGVWCRGPICRALADKGVTQAMINFKRS
jgi:hypothetical protein